MTPAARISAAIEVLEAVASQHRPASEALKDWGRSHRFAGSGDRAAIGNLVFDALRRRASLGWRMGSDAPRALALATWHHVWGEPVDAIERTVAADPHGPGVLTDDERSALAAGDLAAAPDWVRADVPEWLAPALAESFAGRLPEEGAALAVRAPIDLRVNTLKANREKVLARLDHVGATVTRWSPVGVRVPVGEGAKRPPHVEGETEYARGWFEIQDEGSQLAALVAGARPGDQVVDLCAGAGGKTLALAAEMGNRGQIYAYDSDARRFGDIVARIDRSGARNIQVRSPKRPEPLADLRDRADLVLIDAPCTGSGTWRRRPDAKWRLTEAQLATRIAEQDAVLDEGAPLVRPGGRLVYVTCSLLPAENEARIAAFLARTPEFRLTDPAGAWLTALGAPLPDALTVDIAGHGRAIRLTPASAGTDGFFVATMERAG
jgi:16S rRNA (cytosine967-C5)-methyltransferase